MSRIQSLLVCALFSLGCKSAPEAGPAQGAQSTGATPATSASTSTSASASATTSTSTAVGVGIGVRVYDDKATAIEVRVGEMFEVSLPANITTPFKWSLDTAALSGIASLRSQVYTDAVPAECAGCVGYPGTADFLLEAVQAGTGKLHFAYRKLGQTTGEAKREVTINLTVAP